MTTVKYVTMNSSVDAELIEEIGEAVSLIDNVSFVENERANLILTEFAKRYKIPNLTKWTWVSVENDCARLSYSDGDGLGLLTKLIANKEHCFLVITDDEEPPWPVLEGDAREIITAIENCRYFEFLLIGKDLDWFVFDTHQNVLYTKGTEEI